MNSQQSNPQQPPTARLFWPFGPLTAAQQRAREEMQRAAQADELRRPPTVFGALA